MPRKFLFFLFVAAMLLTIALLAQHKTRLSASRKIKTFEDCAAAGYPVMESYPRQCTLPSGKFFVEQVVPER